MTSIGATGHRRLNGSSSIERGIDAAIIKIRGAFSEPFELYTSLAEGADRLVAGRALFLLQAQLVVILPMSLPDYLTDFSAQSQNELGAALRQAKKVIEMPPLTAPQLTRSAAYEAAGRYMLDHVGVLIAVWDGQLARGPGGTGQIVTEARQRGMPVAWVYAGNQSINSIHPQGTLTLERFPEFGG